MASLSSDNLFQNKIYRNTGILNNGFLVGRILIYKNIQKYKYFKYRDFVFIKVLFVQNIHKYRYFKL